MLTLLFLSLLLTPLLVPTFIRPARRRRATSARARAARAARLNPVQASAAEAAVARVVTAGHRYAGHTLQLPCRNCAADSPPIPFECSGLVPIPGKGHVLTAMCSACNEPLISRVLDEETAEHARKLGAIDGEQAEADLARTLAVL